METVAEKKDSTELIGDRSSRFGLKPGRISTPEVMMVQRQRGLCHDEDGALLKFPLSACSGRVFPSFL